MRGLNEIITANAATSQMKPQEMTRQEKEKLILDFLEYIDEVEGWEIAERFVPNFLDKHGE